MDPRLVALIEERETRIARLTAELKQEKKALRKLKAAAELKPPY